MPGKILNKEFLFPKAKEVIDSFGEIGETGNVTLAVGPPGSGKSVFMQQIYNAAKDKFDYLIAIRAELLSEEDSPKEVYNLFEKIKDSNQPKILLLDSLDVLAYSRREELLEWLSYINKLRDIKGMRIICTSRDFEANHLYPMNQQEWSDKVVLQPLPDEFINKIFSKLNYDHEKISPSFREFLRIPLHLKIVAEIIQNGGDPTDTCTLQGLYTKLCEILEISQPELALLTELSERMIKDRTVYLSSTSIGIPLLENIKKMERPGITGLIQTDSTNERFSFAHQTLIDYFSALKVINEKKLVRDFIFENKQSLFIRPVLRHILGLLRLSSSRRRLIDELSEIFFSDGIYKEVGFSAEPIKIRTYIKTAIIADLASWDQPSASEADFLLRIFKEEREGQVCKINFFKSSPNIGWYYILKDKHIVPLLNSSNSSNIDYRMVAVYITEVLIDEPKESLEIISLLLKQGHNDYTAWLLKKLFDNLAAVQLKGDIINDYCDLLEKSLREKYITRPFALQLNCSRLAKYKPEVALELYFELAGEELKGEKKVDLFRKSNITGFFREVLSPIYMRFSYMVLDRTTNFFEQFFSPHSVDNRLYDSPNLLLYEGLPHFGLSAFYETYKNWTLEFCSNISEESKAVIDKLQKSNWETQQQLAILCELKQPKLFKADIRNYISGVLDEISTDRGSLGHPTLLKRAIEAGYLQFTDQEKIEITNKILTLESDDKFFVKVWIWGPLNHIPSEYQTSAVQDKIKEINDKYGLGEYEYIPPISTTGVQKARPILTADELRAKEPEDLYELLKENRHLQRDWSADDIFYGGVELLAQEVSKVFIEDLAKYRNLINQLALDPENDEYIASLFCELWQKGIDNNEIDWVISLMQSTYKREKVQVELTSLLGKLSDNISQTQFDELKEILTVLSDAEDPSEDRFITYRKEGYTGDALTEGINSTRGTLTEVVIRLMTRFQDEYLSSILEKLSNDKTISVRTALIRYLPYAIESVGWDKCFRFFQTACQKDAIEYHQFILRFLRYLPVEKKDQAKSIIEFLKENRANELGTTYAQLMTIYSLRGLITDRELIDILSDEELKEEGKKESFDLLAYQLDFPENTDKCLHIINAMLDFNDDLSYPIISIYINAKAENFHKLKPLTEKIIKDRNLRGEALYYILGYMEKSILLDPLKVFKLLELLLEEWDVDCSNMRDYIPAISSKAPLNIINTILECYPDKEDRALSALDKLIQHNWDGVDEYLAAFDRL